MVKGTRKGGRGDGGGGRGEIETRPKCQGSMARHFSSPGPFHAFLLLRLVELHRAWNEVVFNVRFFYLLLYLPRFCLQQMTFLLLQKT